jgi:hypothetical protein
MTDRMRELEAREDVLKELLAQGPKDILDIHPNVSGIYRKKVERLTTALNNPEDRNEAAEAIRALVEKIALRPGPNRGEFDATLHGELGTILSWIEAQAVERLGNAKLPQLSLRECRSRWLRGHATTDSCDWTRDYSEAGCIKPMWHPSEGKGHTFQSCPGAPIYTRAARRTAPSHRRNEQPSQLHSGNRHGSLSAPKTRARFHKYRPLCRTSKSRRASVAVIDLMFKTVCSPRKSPSSALRPAPIF